MCLFVRSEDPATPFTVKRPIVVWKDLEMTNGRMHPPHFSSFTYVFGRTHTSKLEYCDHNVSKGLHAYITGDEDRIPAWGTLYPAIVPVGAKVYFGAASYYDLAADKLIVFRSKAHLLARYPGARFNRPRPTAAFVE